MSHWPDTPRRVVRPASAWCTGLLLAAVLAGCSSTPKAPGARPGPARAGERDGVDASRTPTDLSKVPDAEPRIEPIRPGGPNKPYEVLGRDYAPQRDDQPLAERGIASWYGKKFHGRRTASGEIYNMYAMTAAHKTMPIPSYARVRNPKNGREVIVRINDRGPFHAGRVIDLSYAAAVRLGVQNGVAPVELERITHDDIRTGAWRRGGSPAIEVASPPPVEPVPLPVPAAVEATPEPAEKVAVTRALTTAAEGFWIQLGAFKQRDGAEQFQRRVSDELDWLGPQLAVFGEPALFRLQAGPYPTRGPHPRRDPAGDGDRREATLIAAPAKRPGGRGCGRVVASRGAAVQAARMGVSGIPDRPSPSGSR